MLINKPILIGVTERLKIKVYYNAKMHFSKHFIGRMQYWICQHKRLYKIFGFQVLLLVLTKYLTNYSMKQVFQDRNQISNQLKLSWNTWCDSSHSSPTFPLLPRGGSREGCAGLFQLTVGCFHTFGFSFNPSFSE